MIGRFKFSDARLTTDYRTHDNILTLVVDKDSSVAVRQILDELTGKDTYICEISKPKRKRTLDQNAYMWVLLDRIAKATRQTKEAVYREIIKRVGVFDVPCLRDYAVDRYIAHWEGRGIGWVCDTDTSDIEGCTNVISYYGTSVYSSDEMRRVIDEVLTECQELGISTSVSGYKEV